jgi:hypothetical protein
MFQGTADPGLGGLFAALGHRIESPGPVTGGDLIGIQQTASAFFTAGHAYNHEVPSNEWGARGAVAIFHRSDFDVPDFFTRFAIQGKHMSVVRDHQQPVSRDHGAAVRAFAGVAQQSCCMRLPAHPHLLAGGGIKRINFVPAGYIHDAIHNGGRGFNARRVGNRE